MRFIIMLIYASYHNNEFVLSHIGHAFAWHKCATVSLRYLSFQMYKWTAHGTEQPIADAKTKIHTSQGSINIQTQKHFINLIRTYSSTE